MFLLLAALLARAMGHSAVSQVDNSRSVRFVLVLFGRLHVDPSRRWEAAKRSELARAHLSPSHHVECDIVGASRRGEAHIESVSL